MERLTNRLTVAEKENHELKSSLGASQTECKELRQEHQALLEWKNQKEALINETEAVQKELTDKIGNLENDLGSLNNTKDQLNVSCSATLLYADAYLVIFNIQTVIAIKILMRICFQARVTRCTLGHVLSLL